MKPSMKRFSGKTICRAAAGVVAAVFFSCGGADALQLPPAVRLARKLEQRAVESLVRAEQAGPEAAAEARRALHSLTQARDVLVKKRRPRPPEYVEELENVRALAYWISRKTSVKDVGGLDRLYLPKDPPEEAGRGLFKKAEDYALRRGSESFVLAARYFEISDRYSGTGPGREARALYITHHDAALTGRPVRARARVRRVDEELPAFRSRRDNLVEELAEMLGEPDISADDKLDACEKFLRERPGHSLVREVAALMDIFAATTAEERIAATKDYLKLFPNGYFAKHLPKIKDEAREGEDFDALVFELRSKRPASEKELACRRFLAVHSGGMHGEETTALLKVYSARSQDRRTVAWVDYRAAFPTGVLRTRAEEQLRRSEPLLLVQIKQALVDDEEKRARSVGGVYLDLFPRGPAVREIRQLFEVLQKPRGPARAWAAEKYIKNHRDGTFTPILRKVVGIWRKKSEEADYSQVCNAFLAASSRTAGSGKARLRAIEEFLRANPAGGRSAEVRGLRSIFKLRGAKGRLIAARKYLELYPAGGVVEAVRVIERDLAAKYEVELYEVVASSLRSSAKGMVAKLAVVDEYLAEYPQSAHSTEISAAARTMRARIAEEEKAAADLEKRLAGVRDPGEGVRLCDAFAARYPGGPHLGLIKEIRRGFRKRLLEREEVTEYKSLSGELKDSRRPTIERAELCLAFVRKHPKSKYLGDVRAAMAKLAPHELPSHAGEVRAAAFTSDSGHLVTLDASARTRDSGVWVWEVPSGRLVARYAPRPRLTVESAAFAPAVGTQDGNELWICGAAGGLLAWTILGGNSGGGGGAGEAGERGGILDRYHLGWGSLRALGASEDRKVVVSASYGDPKVRSWDAESWEPLGDSYAIPGGASAVAVDSRGGLIAAGGRGGVVAVYDVNDTEAAWIADDVHTREIDQLLFSPDDRYLVSVSGAEGLVVMWEADSGDDLWQVKEKSTGVAFTGSGLVVTGPSLRDVATGSVVAELGGAGAVAASPDGRFAFTTGEEAGSGVLWYLPALGGR